MMATLGACGLVVEVCTLSTAVRVIISNTAVVEEIVCAIVFTFFLGKLNTFIIRMAALPILKYYAGQ